jgi:hypothetical protein
MGDIMFRATLALSGLVGLCALTGPALAQSPTCQSEIARVQIIVDKAEAGGPPAQDLKEGSFATLHRQPTAASVLAADQAALAKAKAALAKAKSLQAAHKDAACLKALDEIVY